MSDDLKPGIGTIVRISDVLPANELLATYQALTYVDIGEITDVPKYGPSHDVVTHTPLATGITAKYHGIKNNGSLTLPMALDLTDAGQTAAKAALAGKARVAFEIEYADGATDYFQGKVMSFVRGASSGEVVSAEMSIEIETDIVEDTP